MGTYRFILAIAVVISHCLVTWWGYNPGIVAVISFFVISGYAMAATVRKNFNGLGHLGSFYLDRGLRLFPQYLIYLGITAALFYAGLLTSEAFLRDMNGRRALMNIVILPLGIPRQPGFDMSRSSFIPQAWSLALEITFYICVPFVLMTGKTIRRVVAAGSCAVALLAATQAIDSYAFGYLTLPGTLFVFMIGIELYERRDPMLLYALFWFALLLCVAVHLNPHFQGAGSKEVSAGAVIAALVTFTITRFPLTLPAAVTRIDQVLGDMSYGVFLSHYIFIWLLMTHLRLGYAPMAANLVAAVIAASVASAAITLWLVERPIHALRKSLRRAVT